MLVLDTVLLGDYLGGEPEARRFLERYEREAWAVPSIVLYEAVEGRLTGPADGSPDVVRQAVTASMDVLAVTEATAAEAASVRAELRRRGVPVDHRDALVAGTARERGATLATAEEQFWREEAGAVLSVAEYDPSDRLRPVA